MWEHEATFDVLGTHSELDISIYDASQDDMFLGQIRLHPKTNSATAGIHSEWHKLKSRTLGEHVTGEILIHWEYTSTTVSYTHLDVYKRQEQCCCDCMSHV